MNHGRPSDEAQEMVIEMVPTSSEPRALSDTEMALSDEETVGDVSHNLSSAVVPATTLAMETADDDHKPQATGTTGISNPSQLGEKAAAMADPDSEAPKSAAPKNNFETTADSNDRAAALPTPPYVGAGANLAFNEIGQEVTREEEVPSQIGGYDLSSRDLLGRGAFSLVFKGIQQNTGKAVAVKAVTLVPENPVGFYAELKANRVALGHPNIVSLLDSHPPVGHTGFLMFELCERGEVFDMITPSVGLVPRELIGFYFAQLVGAVLHIHGRGICHLDIKTENLFVDGNGRVKLGDFGLATFAEDGPVVGCRGSLAYAAPENVRSSRRTQEVFGCRAPGQGYDGQKADIWSIGVVLFVLLYGLTPWEIARDSSYEYRMYKLSGGYPNMQPWVRIPTAIRTLFHHTMWSRPARRWTAEQLRSYITRDLGWSPSPPKAFLQMTMQKMQKALAAAPR